MENFFDQDEIFDEEHKNLLNELEDEYEDVCYLTDDEYFDMLEVKQKSEDIKDVIENIKKQRE